MITPRQPIPHADCPDCGDDVAGHLHTGVDQLIADDQGNGPIRDDLVLEGERWFCLNPTCRAVGEWSCDHDGAQMGDATGYLDAVEHVALLAEVAPC